MYLESGDSKPLQDAKAELKAAQDAYDQRLLEGDLTQEDVSAAGQNVSANTNYKKLSSLQEEISALDDSIAAYDLAFSTYKYETATEALAAAKALGVIIAQFLAGELADDTAISGTVAGALADGTVRYYSIDGTPLAAPRRGLIIVRQGNKVRKMMVRN